MTGMTSQNPFEPFLQAMWPRMAAGAGTSERFNQAILPGWSLISVNQGNSSAPDTEQAIVAKASYGRQLGRIMDALDVLIRTVNPELTGDDADAITEFDALLNKIRVAKTEAAEARIKRLTADLASLKAANADEYAKQMEALMAVVEDYKASRRAG